ncbi:MAG: hypothetical protein AB7U79_02990 [Candidatus Izemoplasmatales bacterium]
MNSIEKMIRIEKDGLCDTIIQYTNDRFILSYAKQLKNIRYDDDKEVFIELVSKLYQWYVTTIEKIMSSEFTLDKSAHQKSKNILKQILEYIDKED